MGEWPRLYEGLWVRTGRSAWAFCGEGVVRRSGRRCPARRVVEPAITLRVLLFVPGDGFFEAVFEGGLGGEVELFFGAGGVEAAPGLSVGFGGVPLDLAFEAGEVGDEFGEGFDGDFAAGAEIDGFGFVVFFRGENDAFGGVFDVEEFAAGAAGAPGFDVAGIAAPGFDALTDEGGDDVGGLQIKVVAWAVEIHREQIDGVHTVLLAVGLAHSEEGFFGDAVGGVGFFGEAVPEVVFLKRHGRELGVGADGADLDEFPDFVDACLFDEVESHGHVGEEEAAGVFAVGADAADFGGEVDDDVGFDLPDQVGDGGFVGEVALGAAWNDDVVAIDAALEEFFGDEGAKKSGAAGDEVTHEKPRENREVRAGSPRYVHCARERPTIWCGDHRRKQVRREIVGQRFDILDCGCVGCSGAGVVGGMGDIGGDAFGERKED